VAPLAAMLSQTEQTEILITTATPTAADWVAQNMPDVAHIGLPADAVQVLPDLRLAQPKLSVSPSLTTQLTQTLGSRPLWLAASTHEADEEPVLAAHQSVLATQPDAVLILAPRHPKRAQQIQQCAKAMGLRVAQRSAGDSITPEVQIYLADTLGELGAFFAAAPITFLSGSFGADGGHNPYEPAHFATALLHGPHVPNFSDAYAALGREGAALKVEDADALAQAVLRLLDSTQSKEMGQAGLDFINATRNCTEDYADLITQVLRARK